MADLRWLIGGDAATALALAGDESLSLLARGDRLRKTLSSERARLVLEQATLRSKAGSKFFAAERMFFTPVGLQQSTDQYIASHKAIRFSTGPIADLCCGIGGDAMALAAKAPGSRRGVVAADFDAGIAKLAGANLRATEMADKSIVVACDAAAFPVENFSAWHIDPDRRAKGHRRSQLEGYEPSREVLEELLRRNSNAAVKLAPAAEAPAEWMERAELEWISRNGECKQLVAWMGKLTEQPGMRRATVLAADGTTLASVVGEAGRASLLGDQVGQYLYEPDAAVLAADLTGVIAERYSLRPLIPGGGYLTSDALIDEPALARFEVEAAIPYRAAAVKRLLAERSIGRLEVKKRGVELEPEKVRRELQSRGDEQATLILTRLGQKVIAILAERI